MARHNDTDYAAAYDAAKAQAAEERRQAFRRAPRPVPG